MEAIISFYPFDTRLEGKSENMLSLFVVRFVFLFLNVTKALLTLIMSEDVLYSESTDYLHLILDLCRLLRNIEATYTQAKHLQLNTNLVHSWLKVRQFYWKTHLNCELNILHVCSVTSSKPLLMRAMLIKD